jgi:hypothetical protein
MKGYSYLFRITFAGLGLLIFRNKTATRTAWMG